MFEDRRLIDSVWFRIVAIVLAAALVVVLFVVRNQQMMDAREERQRETRECEQAIAPLKQQREEILQEIKDLELKISGGDLHLATALIMYVQPNDVLINDSLSVVKKYGFPCLVCCEAGSFPGDPNCITREQALELSALGWQFGLSLAPEDDVPLLCDEMTRLGLPSPAFAYYPRSDFNADDPDAEQALLSQGIQTVLQYNFIPEDSDEHKLNYIAAYGFREKNCRSVLQNTVNNSNTLTFTIGYTNPYERYESRPFVSMTSLFQGHVEEERLQVTTIDQALARRDEFSAELEARQSELTAQKTACEQRLAELDDEITRVYHQFISE